MNPEDRACFNCGYSKVCNIPLVAAKSEADYWGLCLCLNKESDHHYQHYLSLHHRCYWHSDEDYPNKPPLPSKEER